MTTAGRGFDQLAPVYRPLEFLAFGADLERARFAHLAALRPCRSVLVLGEGDGRCLARLVREAPQARITCVDLSEGMLRSAARRMARSDPGAASRVQFRCANALEFPLEPGAYDAAVTCFFLDCFGESDARRMVARIDASLAPGASWIWADFALPSRGWRRLRARAWLAVLYGFFRLQTRIAAHSLPPVEEALAAAGWHAQSELTLQGGLLRSAHLRRREQGTA